MSPVIETTAPPPYQTPNITGWTNVNLGAASGPFNYDTDTQTVNIGTGETKILVPPARQHVGSITINFTGDNGKVIIQGLYKTIGLTGAGLDPSPCVSTTTQDSGALNLKIQDNSHVGCQVWIEGLHIAGASGPISPAWGYPVEQDGLRYSCHNTIVWCKNCRIEGLIGGLNPPHRHADSWQPDGGCLEAHFEDCELSSHYNNFYVRRENSPLNWPVKHLFMNRCELRGYDTNPADAPTGTNTTPGGLTKTISALSFGTQPSTADGGPGNNSSPTNGLLPTSVWLKDVYANPPAGLTLGKFLHPGSGQYGAPTVSADGSYAYWSAWDDTSPPPANETTPVVNATDPGSGDAKVYGVVKLGPAPVSYAPANKIGLNFTGTFTTATTPGGVRIKQIRGFASPTPVASISLAWPLPTNKGNKLFAFVAFNANGVNGVNMSPALSAWQTAQPGTKRRQATSLDQLVATVYEINNAASRSGTETFTFTASKYGLLILVELEGTDTANIIDLFLSAAAGGLAVTLGPTGSPATDDGIALSFVLNGNPATDQSVDISTPGWTQQIDLNSGSNGSDRIRGALYSKPISKSDFPSLTVDLTGVTTRNMLGILQTFTQVSTGPTGPAAPIITAAPVDGSGPNVSFTVQEPGT